MIRYAVIYNYKRTGNLKSDGTAPVLIRTYLDKRIKFFNTRVYVRPDQWDNSNRRVKNHPNQFQLNRAIKDELQALEHFEFEVLNRSNSITLDRLADYKKDDFRITFTEFYEKHLRQCKLRKQSVKDQQQTLFKLNSFRKQIFFKELNYKLVKDFNTFLHNQHLSINTIAKHHKNLKKYINLAINCGHLDLNDYPYRQFKIKKEVPETTYLTEYELNQLEKLYIPYANEVHRQIRDCFLFACYTGMRFSDVSTMTAANFTKTDKGLELYYVARKTKKPLRLLLKNFFKGKPEKLINYYLEKYEPFYLGKGESKPMPIFFGRTNQYTNRELKKIVKELNIRDVVKEKISMHVARHTFGTIMAGKVKPQTLQKLMQHSRITETMPYIHLNQELINKELEAIKW